MLGKNGEILDVKFPLNNGQRYWSIHYLYVLNIFKHLKYNISFRDMTDRGNAFIVELNGKEFLFDYADTADVAQTTLPVFKFHAEVGSLAYPFPPVSFYDWEKFEHLKKTIKYSTDNNLFSYRTIPYGNARERRSKVLAQLKSDMSETLLSGTVQQEQFFNEISKIRAYIHVPGHHNNMVDRSTIQMFALGCPVITTYIPDLLPYGNTWDNCYIPCMDDYIDLVARAKTAKSDHLIVISERAKTQFDNFCTPKAIDKYLQEIICGI